MLVETLMDRNSKDNTFVQRPIQKHFDWGPSSSNFVENMKEAFLYLIVIVFLAFGAWCLVGWKETTGVEVESTHSLQSSQEDEIISNITSSHSFEGNYFVQLGAFADRTSAEEAHQNLLNLGFVPVLSEPEGQFEIYRISFGPFVTEAEADEISRRLNSKGYFSFVIESF